MHKFIQTNAPNPTERINRLSDFEKIALVKLQYKEKIDALKSQGKNPVLWIEGDKVEIILPVKSISKEVVYHNTKSKEEKKNYYIKKGRLSMNKSTKEFYDKVLSIFENNNYLKAKDIAELLDYDVHKVYRAMSKLKLKPENELDDKILKIYYQHTFISGPKLAKLSNASVSYVYNVLRKNNLIIKK